VRTGGLLASPLLAATRGMAMASIGTIVPAELSADHVTFDDLGVAPAEVEVFGRADMSVAIDMRRLPAGTRPARLLLDVMVAPDGAGEKAVVSTYVGDRFIASAVAATAEATHFDIALPDGLLGTTANIRAVVQRRSAEGDCRFEPQGYPAQILGSSAFVLGKAAGKPHDFSDLTARWALGIDLSIPESAANQPAPVLGLVAEILSALSADSAPIKVSLVAPGKSPAPTGPFLAVSDTAPEGVSPYARFDLGRVVVADRAGHTVLDVGGFVSGAVAQLVTAGEHSGLWIKPLAAAGALPAPAALRLEHGDVAFIDATGVTLAMSTERDTLIRISYPDQVSWLTVAERFRTWIIGGLWACATITFLFVLQRLFRRRRSTLNE
jgi:cellulose synthase operon protein B